MFDPVGLSIKEVKYINRLHKRRMSRIKKDQELRDGNRIPIHFEKKEELTEKEVIEQQLEDMEDI